MGNASSAVAGNLTGTAIADPTIPSVPAEPGARFSQNLGVNDGGIAVGYYGDSTTSQHGFFYNTHTGVYTFLDDPSEQFSNGVVVTQNYRHRQFGRDHRVLLRCQRSLSWLRRLGRAGAGFRGVREHRPECSGFAVLPPQAPFAPRPTLSPRVCPVANRTHEAAIRGRRVGGAQYEPIASESGEER
jgi:hypothetical protein